MTNDANLCYSTHAKAVSINKSISHHMFTVTTAAKVIVNVVCHSIKG